MALFCGVLPVRGKGMVTYPCLNSYAAELSAVLQACIVTPYTVHIYSDCQSAVEAAQYVFQHGTYDDSWLCQEWWSCLPFQITWIPAHCYEHLLPVEHITPSMAASKGTTIQHIRCNRKADHTAKEFAAAVSPVHPGVQQQADLGILHHQRWLSRLHALLPTDGPQQTAEEEPAEDFDFLSCQKIFPQWAWNWEISFFSCKPKVPLQLDVPPKWDGTNADWQKFVLFSESYAGSRAPPRSLHFVNLRCCFTNKGDPLLVTLSWLHTLICIIRFGSQLHCCFMMTEFLCSLARICISLRRLLAARCHRAQAAFLGNDTLVHLARVFALGAGRTLSSWKVPLL